MYIQVNGCKWRETGHKLSSFTTELASSTFSQLSFTFKRANVPDLVQESLFPFQGSFHCTLTSLFPFAQNLSTMSLSSSKAPCVYVLTIGLHRPVISALAESTGVPVVPLESALAEAKSAVHCLITSSPHGTRRAKWKTMDQMVRRGQREIIRFSVFVFQISLSSHLLDVPSEIFQGILATSKHHRRSVYNGSFSEVKANINWNLWTSFSWSSVEVKSYEQFMQSSGQVQGKPNAPEILRLVTSQVALLL